MSPRGRSLVVAIGGNALSPAGESASVANQFRHTRESMGVVVALAEEGWHIAIVHGNGPQVGDELRRNELAQGPEELRQNYAELERDFREFFPQLKEYVEGLRHTD